MEIKYIRRRKAREVIVPIGPSVAYLQLTQGQFGLIDRGDAALLGCRNWYALWSKDTQSFYAVGWYGGEKIKLHRLLLGLDRGDARQGDHANGNTLDFRRNNLRIATLEQNRRNCRRNRRNTSGFKGVNRSGKKWIARLKVDGGLRLYLGRFATPEAAGRAYAAAARLHHREFARIA